MFISVFGYLSLFVGFLVLFLPLILIELTRPRDWVIGGLFLFLGLFFLVENELLTGSINLLVISMAFLLGKMMSEIAQNRWFQLSIEEKKRIGSFERWFESFKQFGQIVSQLGNVVLNFFISFKKQTKKSRKEKKWVHPQLKEEIKTKSDEQSDSIDSNTSGKEKLTENEESS
tara:strand:- start:29 stop:547 length:519 start_codon:yes stop_codon:yes gene_type:complete